MIVVVLSQPERLALFTVGDVLRIPLQKRRLRSIQRVAKVTNAILAVI